MPNVEITLLKDEKATGTGILPDETMETTISEVDDINLPVSVPSLAKYTSLTAIAKMTYELYQKIRDLELDKREINETLRNYGGKNFSANTIGDTYDIFGRRNSGISVEYKK